ncbi:hypothetical protein KBI52_21055 [Microvirga sp. HBU67558]|uniref:di-heme-cytochrome C peroxidase n=1 Tax=Microvirga TaxID=186650 RepID=UPI001B3787CD|nr:MULTISPECIES: di-heme-cytochrome C peroxidase [unclassified Microvirga]MBQ0822679.1 hypothetical protein [Microvirga sp. HBU67558]
MFSSCRALRFLAAVVTFVAGTHSLSHAQDAQPLPELDQGWSNEQRNSWWGATQGSRLIPLDWFNALEISGGQDRFASIAVMSRFGYLRRPGAPPEWLPIGFAIDDQSDDRLQRTKLRWKAGQGNNEKWLGLTCSACHTGTFSHNGKTYLVEGAGGLTDFQSFMETLNRSLEETRSDKQKWDAFEVRVLGRDKTDENVRRLAEAYDALLAWQLKEENINATPLRYGPGRIDAFGHIYNKVALTLAPNKARQNPSDAPVSIPFIWRAPQFDRVQYNGMAPKVPILGSFDVGAVGRNTGEVIGVFGDVVPNANPGLVNGFASSVLVTQLSQLEDVLSELRPPRWPASILGAVDQAKADRGRALFDSRCASCHEPVNRTDVKTRLTVEMSLLDGSGRNTRTGKPLPPPGTDPWMACNAYAYKSSPGIVSGFRSRVLTEDEMISTSEEERLAMLLKVTVGAVIMDKKKDIASEALRKLFRVRALPDVEGALIDVPQISENPGRSPAKQAQLVDCMRSKDPNLGYTSRPLNGIWATAPFLHNGSIPNMYELLLPPRQRSQAFFVGTREYDPQKMGYKTDRSSAGNTFEFRSQYDQGRLIDGNSNLGHDYENEKLTDDHRYELIEYLKQL